MALCLAAALLPIMVRRRWLRGTLSARPNEEHPPPAVSSNDTVILVGSDSPRTQALSVRQQSSSGVVSRQHLNSALSGKGGEA